MADVIDVVGAVVASLGLVLMTEAVMGRKEGVVSPQPYRLVPSISSLYLHIPLPSSPVDVQSSQREEPRIPHLKGRKRGGREGRGEEDGKGQCVREG